VVAHHHAGGRLVLDGAIVDTAGSNLAEDPLDLMWRGA
jgi:hypothetical protein